MEKVVCAGGRFDVSDDLSEAEITRIGQQCVNAIVKNLELRFSDEVSDLCHLKDIPGRMKEPPSAHFIKLSAILHVSSADLSKDWSILHRLLKLQP